MKTQVAVRSIVLIFLLTSQAFSQEAKDQLLIQRQQKEIAEKIEADWNEINRILQEEYPTDDASLSKSMSRDQRDRHRDAILEQYRKMGYTHGYQACYNRHILPSKRNELKKIGMLRQPGQQYSFRDHALISEVVVIGRVRKLVYHPKQSDFFHTSIHVVVDEWLRDDFQLSKKYDEVVIKYRSGPIEGGSSLGASLEPRLQIGEKLVLFLSRDGYVSELVWHSRHYSRDDFIPNVFVAMGAGQKFVIEGPNVIIGRERVSLDRVRTDIARIVRILDVQNFHKSY